MTQSRPAGQRQYSFAHEMLRPCVISGTKAFDSAISCCRGDRWAAILRFIGCDDDTLTQATVVGRFALSAAVGSAFITAGRYGTAEAYAHLATMMPSELWTMGHAATYVAVSRRINHVGQYGARFFEDGLPQLPRHI